MNRPVLARTPLPRAPVPFDRQVSAMAANGGRPLAQPELAPLQPAAAAVPVRMVGTSPVLHPPGSAHGMTGTPRGQGATAPAAANSPSRDDYAPLTAAPRTTTAQPTRSYGNPAPAPGANSSQASGAPYAQRPPPAYRPPAPGVGSAPVRETAPAPMREVAPVMQPPHPVTPHPPAPPPSAPKSAPQPASHDLSNR